MWSFQSLETYTGVIWQASIADTRYRADLWRFDVEPTVWLSRHSTPLLTGSRPWFRIADMLSNHLAPILRPRWPKLAH